MAAVLLVITSLQLAHRSAPPSHYSSGGATPGAPERERSAPADPERVAGDAPWALSALPECFRQLSSARGSTAFAQTKIPPGARLVPSGSAVEVADCTLEVFPQEVRVSRGSERLRIPPRARLLLSGERKLVLDRRSGAVEEVRVYAPTGDSRPVVRRLKAAVP